LIKTKIRGGSLIPIKEQDPPPFFFVTSTKEQKSLFFLSSQIGFFNFRIVEEFL
jgi:hypothetical protein